MNRNVWKARNVNLRSQYIRWVNKMTIQKYELTCKTAEITVKYCKKKKNLHGGDITCARSHSRAMYRTMKTSITWASNISYTSQTHINPQGQKKATAWKFKKRCYGCLSAMHGYSRLNSWRLEMENGISACFASFRKTRLKFSQIFYFIGSGKSDRILTVEAGSQWESRQTCIGLFVWCLTALSAPTGYIVP